MYHESTVVVNPAVNVTRAYLSADGSIPVITIVEAEFSNNVLRIQLPAADPAAATAWLRNLSAACDDLAEQVELTARPGLALAERHIAEAKATAGIGGQR